MLMWVFAPAARIRERQTEPRLYWLTRAALAKNVSKLKVENTRARGEAEIPSSEAVSCS
jgi:hypothetical protein